MVELKGLRRHYNACIVSGTKLTYPDHVTGSGICASCIKCGLCEIGKKAKDGMTIFPQPFGSAQFGAEKRLPSINDVQIIPELIGEEIIFRNVLTETNFGSIKSKLPVAVAAMGSTDVASKHSIDLCRQSALAGIPMVVGENVLASFGEKGLKDRIKTYNDFFDGKFGGILVQGNAVEMKHSVLEKGVEFGAKGIEIKFSQGAKPGLGGEIKFSDKVLAEKFKKFGFIVIEEKPGLFQRHALPGSLTKDGLRKIIEKYSDLKVPIWFKATMAHGLLQVIEWLEEFKKEFNAKIECLTVDGFGGGTGMSPWLIMNEVGLPSACLFAGLQKKPSFDVLLAGGFTTGADIVKALLFGAKGVAMGRSMLIAVACNKENGIQNYCNALKEELQMFCASLRVKDCNQLIGRKKNLYPLTPTVAELFGLNADIKKVL